MTTAAGPAQAPGPLGGVTAYVVEEQPNPSTDYFVGPALSALGANVIKCHTDHVPGPAALQNAVVVFVRYVPPHWARAIGSMGTSPRRLIFFMDDDVLDWRASRGMPLRYRFKLARLAAARGPWLARQRAELWVSTPYLQEKYAAWGARLVPPTPVTGEQATIQLFYHGTASHQAEIRWLRPVVEGALTREPRLCFEVVGGRDVHRLYRDLPRVRVVHPMKWPAYGGFIEGGARDIGLAPLLEVPFNRARSFTKFMDITRAGAAGIYSPGGACAEVVEHGVDGLVVPLQVDAWIDAVVELAADARRRTLLAANAARKVTQLAQSARSAYGALGSPARV